VHYDGKIGSWLLVACLASAVLLFCALRADGQASSSISGMVTDPSGAAVASATVTAVNHNTGLIRVTHTDDGGRFHFSALPVGQYELRIQKPGFAQEIREGIQLVVGEDAVLNLPLRLGPVTQQVTVSAAAPLISAFTTDVSGLVAEQQVQDLPLNGRSYDELLSLNPGIVNFTAEKVGGIGVSNSTVGNDFAVSGNRPQQNLFLLNGIEFTGAAENNMQPGGVSGQLLGVDAVREFNVLRHSYGAKYGKRPGAQVLIVTRSGTNQLHGSLYEFLRNSAFDAPNYFDHGTAPPFQRNQFGASFGAPLRKNKAFFFGNFEELLQHLHQTSVALVPDTNARNGYLPCALVTPPPNPCPASGVVFVGVSPLVNAWPLQSPNGVDFGGIAQSFRNPLQTIRDDFGNARLDEIISARNSLTGVYTVDDSADVTPTTADPYSTDVESLREQVLSAEETHVFSSTLLNVARFGFSRASYFFTGEPTPGTPAAALPGFVTGHPIGAIVIGGSAASNPSAQVGLAGSNNGSNLNITRSLFTYEDHVSWTAGEHQFSFGAWFQRVFSNEDLALSQFGQATFTGLQQFLENTVGNFLFDPAPTEMNWRSLLGAFYAQDVWRVMPNFTLSLGLRDEFTSGWNEADGRAATFVFSNGILQTQPRISGSAFTVNNAKFLPQPRIALAWSPFGQKTAIRAGFGMYNDLQDALGYRMDQNAPFNPTYTISNLPLSTLPLPAFSVPSNAKILPAGVQPDLKTPSLLSYSLKIERELLPDTIFSIGYVGSHGYHEIVSLDDNEPTPTVCPASPCPARYPANFPAPLAGTSVPAGTYFISAGAPLANPALGPAWAWFSEGNSSYNALQLDVNHRLRAGLMLRGVYTWSKALDNGDSLNATAAGNAPGLVSNPFDLRADWGPATYDVRSVGVIEASYDLPFGSGRHFLNHLSKVAEQVVAGWSANSILTAQSGFPFTPQLSYNPSNNGDSHNPVRPFVNPVFKGPVILGTPKQWFNPAAFLAPPPGSGFYGNLGRDSLTGPGLATWDLSILKNTALRENLNLQFRAEIFNLLNRANFNTPNTIVFTPSGVSPTAGVITSTATASRQLQFGAKLLW